MPYELSSKKYSAYFKAGLLSVRLLSAATDNFLRNYS